jgi:hypothetical protein
MSCRRNSRVPIEDVVLPRMLYCDLRRSQRLPGMSSGLPGALLCITTRFLGDGKGVILSQRVRGSIRAVRAIRNTRVLQMETTLAADEAPCSMKEFIRAVRYIEHHDVVRSGIFGENIGTKVSGSGHNRRTRP